MPQGTTLRVDGYRQFMQAVAKADRATQRMVRDEIRKAGENVRQDAASLFAATDQKSASGYKVRVRQRGVAVEQSIRKTTGLHPGFGALQMRRALVPAVDQNDGATERAVEAAMERICNRFNGGF